MLTNKRKKYALLLCMLTSAYTYAADNLDSYLHDHNFYLSPVNSSVNEGYMSDSQKSQFNERLGTYKNIKNILEVGLNGGHSCENFFNNFPDLALFVSFDINHHPYTGCAAEYFYSKYNNRFIFVPGDSMKTVPDFQKSHPYYKFDLVFVDGCHAFEWAISDIYHTRDMAHKDTVLWIDDVPADLSGPIGAAVRHCESLGLIEIVNHFHSDHPTQYGRAWLEAKFLY